MKEKIEKIIEKYESEECGEKYYTDVRYDEDENEFWMKDELEEFCKENNLIYKLKKEEGFSSPAYDNEFLALSYLDENGNLQLHTVVIETF